MRRPSTYPRQERWFVCRCGALVLRPESDRFDDSICLNCWYGPAVPDLVEATAK